MDKCMKIYMDDACSVRNINTYMDIKTIYVYRRAGERSKINIHSPQT